MGKPRVKIHVDEIIKNFLMCLPNFLTISFPDVLLVIGTADPQKGVSPLDFTVVVVILTSDGRF